MNDISSSGDSTTTTMRDNPFCAVWTQIQRKSSLLLIFMTWAWMLWMHVCVALMLHKYPKCMRVCACVCVNRLCMWEQIWLNLMQARYLCTVFPNGEREMEVSIVAPEHSRLLFLLPEYTWVARLIFPSLSLFAVKHNKHTHVWCICGSAGQ